MQAVDQGSDGTEYAISDLAALHGVSYRTLRLYEDKELLQPRREGNRRIYSGKDRSRLELILRAKRLGFSLAAIWQLMQSRTRDEAAAPPAASANVLGLTKEQISSQLDYLSGERDRVHRAIEELHGAVSR